MTNRLDRARRLLVDAEAAAGLRPGQVSSASPGRETEPSLTLGGVDGRGGHVATEPGSDGPRDGGRRAGGAAPPGRASASGSAPRRGLRLVPDPPPVDRTDPEPDPHDIARRIVLKRLASAPRSRWELEQTLHRRGCDPAVAGAVLDRLAEAGLVDDEGFAEHFVRSRVATKGLARHALERELRARGVPTDVIDATLTGVSPGAELERARELATRRVRTLHGLPVDVQTRRLAGFLSRKGYPADVVYTAVRDVVAEAPEHARD